MNDTKPTQFYFSLPRAIALLFGGDATRSESNGFEARLISLLVYSIHYLFFATMLVHSDLPGWLAILLLLPLAVAIWPFWLLLIYFTSLIIKLLRLSGLFQTLPTRRAQSILWGILTTVMAGEILKWHPWLWQLALIWLLAVMLNLAAALVLSFSDAARGFDE